MLCCVCYNRIFANAKSLFYYVHRPRVAGKMLSHEQVAALLAQAERRNTTDVTVVEKLASLEEANNTTTTVTVSAIVEQKGVKNSDGVEDPTQVDNIDRALVKETSQVEVVTRKLSNDSDSTADRNDEVSDVLVLPNSGGEPTEGHDEDHMIRQQDRVSQQQAGSGGLQQQQEFTQETVWQPELNHYTTNSSSGIVDKAASPTTAPTHASPTYKVKNSKYVSQGSMFAELKSHGTSTTSIPPTVKKSRVAPWCKPGQQRKGWSHDDHVTSKSSGLNHLQYEEEEEVSTVYWITATTISSYDVISIPFYFIVSLVFHRFTGISLHEVFH